MLEASHSSVNDPQQGGKEASENNVIQERPAQWPNRYERVENSANHDWDDFPCANLCQKGFS